MAANTLAVVNKDRLTPSQRVLAQFAGGLPEAACQLVHAEGTALGMTIMSDATMPTILRSQAASPAQWPLHRARQELVFGRRLPRGVVTIGLGEAALQAGSEVPGQLEHIAWLLLRNTGVSLCVVPEAIRLPYAFTVAKAGPSDPAAVFIGGETGMRRRTDPTTIKWHGDLAQTALMHAFTPAESIDMLMDLAEQSR